MRPLRIVFAGTPEFTIPSLDAIGKSKHQLLAVYTQPDRPAGRGRHLQASAVKEWALTHQIPIHQPLNFKEQQAMREAGDDEAMMLDIDYVEMLEYGMPPACGLGYSERVFWVFEGVSAREGVPFPQLREEIDSVTKSIYPDIN